MNELRNNDLLASPKCKNNEQNDTNGDKTTSNSLHKAEDNKESVKNDGNKSANDTKKIENVAKEEDMNATATEDGITMTETEAVRAVSPQPCPHRPRERLGVKLSTFVSPS